MVWERVGKYGMQCGDYKVGKFYEEGCTLYLLSFKGETLKWCNDFEECRVAAAVHAGLQG